jgi:acyl carrier protein
MPVTINGKLDRKALLKSMEGIGNEFVPPANDLERKLALIWQDLLEIDQVGVYDNFFQIGGHSLLAIQLISRIRHELNVELAFGDVFKFDTISQLSKYLEIRLGFDGQEKDLKEFELLNI